MRWLLAVIGFAAVQVATVSTFIYAAYEPQVELTMAIV